MIKGATKESRGFTIIEVALTIAVGGLIFLMVFVALPSLQRSQRDATRREDVMTYLEQLKKYQTNNRGALPKGEQEWAKFMNDYFSGHADPSGGVYTQEIVSCGSDVKTDEACSATQIQDVYSSSFPYGDNTLLVVKQAYCGSNDTLVKTSNPRNVAVLYRLEGAGVYCSNT
ncbi:type II secretion system protein [Candidatus Saccharibacteria bacterium]|nr:type II secretion system protein [Candidatus Saccharibacteria bacterium]